MTPIFSSKLDRLRDTIEMAAREDHGSLATAIKSCAGTPVFAVGSGGSAIAAEFLATCRASLSHAPTSVVTPMSYVLEARGSLGLPAWLFSASGENQDIQAALSMAAAENVTSLDILTSGAEGTLAKTARAMSGAANAPRVHIAPVADPKDGFLATHSAIAAASALTIAADLAAGVDRIADRCGRMMADVGRWMAREARDDVRGRLAGLQSCDTLLLLYDPQLACAATAIETSCWEAGLCAVHRADFRNFAHGRHVWLARHAPQTFVVALTCEKTYQLWSFIEEQVPGDASTAHFAFGRAGRGTTFESLLASFVIVEAAGALKGVDPGRPGVADFGRRIFDSPGLLQLVEGDDAAVRRKERAQRRIDPPERNVTDWLARRDEYVADLAGADLRALVMDYDGTVVSTEKRLEPPDQEILERLSDLVDHGLIVAFATGRGGSVGEELRKHFSEAQCRKILVGYYNGAHIASLDVDITIAPPQPDGSIATFHERLTEEDGLFVATWRPKKGPLQVSIPFDKLVAGDRGVDRVHAIARELAIGDEPAVKVVRSGHAIDVFPAWAGKTNVVERARQMSGHPEGAILRVGDSGDNQGNDHELLTGPLGLSVGRVCHRETSCWNLAPAQIGGPEGVKRILRAFKTVPGGGVKIIVRDLF